VDAVLEKYERGLRKSRVFIITLLISTIVLSFVSICCGSVIFAPSKVVEVLANRYFGSTFPGVQYWEDIVIVNGRLPRTAMCILAGVSLGMAGTMMQGVLRNPLVSPFTLGVSSAATFGAALAIVYGAGLSFYTVSGTVFGRTVSGATLITALGASALGIMSICLVFALCRRRDVSRSTVILAGVVIGYLFQAGVTFLKYTSNDAALRDITVWTMGGMWNSTWAAVIISLPVVILASLLLWRLALDVDSLTAGDDIARSTGVDVKRTRTLVLIVSTISVSVCMGFTGVIGFIGLMGPHLSRMVIGNRTTFLLPASGLFGASLLLACDTLGRIIMHPGELPAGIIMYLVGGTFFVYLVLRKNNRVV